MERFFGNRRITLYASGTAALAQAITRCTARSTASAPEVIIPAYGCPDLVAACLQANTYPKLVDVAPSHWGYDLESLKSNLSPNTVAVVAVNLLGLGDGCMDLTPLCKERRIALIQDSAQFLPRESTAWPGDYVVLSFGRGKPMNLLGGGALIEPSGENPALSARPGNYTLKDRLLASRGAAIAFNVLTRPRIYGIFSALPGTGLGHVAYKPLVNATLLPARAWERVAPAFDRYRQNPSYLRDIWNPALQEWSGFGIVALACPGSALPAEPLRLALLASDEPARDILVAELNRTGLGASRLYATDLTAISGIPGIIRQQGPFPNASSLARRLFTLPTHRLVGTQTVKVTQKIVHAWHQSRKMADLAQSKQTVQSDMESPISNRGSATAMVERNPTK